MDFIKNAAIVLCLVFLIGCIKFGISQDELKAFNIEQVKFDQNTYPVVILGGGIGGLTSAVYSTQANFNTIVLQGETPGGALTLSPSVRNWPGEMEISGKDLLDKMQQQAIKNGAQILEQTVVDVDFSVWPYHITTKTVGNNAQKVNHIKALTCIIAIGTKPNLLNIPGEKEYFGKGISTCATCDGPLYKDKIVAVIGSGNAAITEANYLSNIAKKVFIILRSDKFKASEKSVNQTISKPNIEVIFDTQIQKIVGNNQKATNVTTYNAKTKKQQNIELDGIFLAVGHKPNSKLFKDELDVDSDGYIVLKNIQETSKTGVFAAGDITNSEYKQAITSAGDSCKAALQAQNFLKKIGYKVEKKVESQKEEKPVIKETPVIEEKPKITVHEILNESEFEKLVLNNKKPVVLDIYASWCMPCKAMAPIFKQLAQNFYPQIEFFKINIESNENLAQKLQIQSVPTFIFMQNGKEADRIVGGRNYEGFKELIEDIF